MRKRRNIIGKNKFYEVDSTAEVHMASLAKGYSNTFRLEVLLKDEVKPELLQDAFRNVQKDFQ